MLEIENTGRLHELEEVLDEDIIIEWPQSGERAHGLANLLKILEHSPGGLGDTSGQSVEFVEAFEGAYLLTPMFTMVKSEGTGDTATSTVKVRYSDGSEWFIVTIAKANAGKLVRMVQHYAPTYDPPAWRARWVEPI